MSLVTEMLDRLSGIAAVREQLNMTSHRVEKLADLMIDHEKRLIRLEVAGASAPASKPVLPSGNRPARR